jgi:hypothetical protein
MSAAMHCTASGEVAWCGVVRLAAAAAVRGRWRNLVRHRRHTQEAMDAAAEQQHQVQVPVPEPSAT